MHPSVQVRARHQPKASRVCHEYAEEVCTRFWSPAFVRSASERNRQLTPAKAACRKLQQCARFAVNPLMKQKKRTGRARAGALQQRLTAVPRLARELQCPFAPKDAPSPVIAHAEANHSYHTGIKCAFSACHDSRTSFRTAAQHAAPYTARIVRSGRGNQRRAHSKPKLSSGNDLQSLQSLWQWSTRRQHLLGSRRCTPARMTRVMPLPDAKQQQQPRQPLLLLNQVPATWGRTSGHL